ncbi:MAG: hypothetical protein GY868_21570 [Deltaproteobacteria bacterium]|nr:hypothetical protein [Deltaproteobacteria bacterium]
MKRSIMIAVFVLFLLPVTCSAFSFNKDNILQYLNWEEQPDSFTAEMATTTVTEKKTVSAVSKVSKKGVALLRIDMEPKMLKAMVRQRGGQMGDFYLLRHKEEQNSYIVFPAKSGYLERNTAQSEVMMQQLAGQLKKSFQQKSTNIQKLEMQGTETVEGVKCDKVHLVMPLKNGITNEITSWLAKDHKHFPMKTVVISTMPNGKTIKNTTQFRNVKKTKLDNSLFEIPEDYTRYDNMVQLMTGGQYGDKLEDAKQKLKDKLQEKRRERQGR